MATWPDQDGATTADTGRVCGHPPATVSWSPAGSPSRSSRRRRRPLPGHDLNIAEDVAAALCPPGTYDVAREAALAVYRFAAAYAEERGILVADTKFELGVDEDGVVTLADEVLTPDSSRFWPAHGFAPGRAAAVVRQAVRARLVPAHRLGSDRPRAGASRDVVAGTRARYVEAFERLTELEVRAVSRRPGGRPVKATVLIRPKTGILDPQGEAVQASLDKLGFPVVAARVGRLVDSSWTRTTPAEARAQVGEDVLPSCSRTHSSRASRSPSVGVTHDVREAAGRGGPFPGSNDDGDAALALELVGAEAVRVWHAEPELPAGVGAVILPGGFCTATTCAAARSPAPLR